MESVSFAILMWDHVLSLEFVMNAIMEVFKDDVLFVEVQE